MTETNANDLSMGAAEAAAERELGDLFSGAPAPENVPQETTPAPAVAAEPPPAAPADGATVAGPEAPGDVAPTGTPQPVVGSTPPADVLSNPAFKKALEIYGGDPEAAAKGFLDTNTRNAKMAGILRSLGYDPKTLEPVAASPASQAAPAQVPVPTEQVVTQEINRILDADPQFNQLVSQYKANDDRLGQIKTENTAIETKIARATLALSLPEIKADAYKVDEYLKDLANARNEKLQLQLEASILEGKQERLDSLARVRSETARKVVTEYYENESRKVAEEKDLANTKAQLYAEMSTAWPLAIEKAIKTLNVPADLIEDFKEEVRKEGLVYLAQEENDIIRDIYGFVAERGKSYMDKYDRYHRARAADYGKLAQQRTVAAAPAVAPSPTQTPTASEATPKSLIDHEAELLKDAALNWNLFLGR